MVEAIVAVALRAVVAGTLLGGVLVLGVFAATRTLALTAATRHALWTLALVATALMPLAGIGVSLARGLGAAASVAPHLAAPGVALATKPHAASQPAPDAVSRPLLQHAKPDANAAAPAGAPIDRLAIARSLAAWTPRLSRIAAIGVVGVWLAGVAIGLFGLVLSILRVRGLKKRSSPLDGELADELPWLTEIGPGREIYLRLSFETETPVAIGFGRPVILIPTELANADGLAAIEPLVLHEHAHLRRYDDWTNVVQRTIERLFWFNPLVWVVGRRIALEREIASDDAVVEKTGEPHEYATSLWRLAREMRMPEHAVVAPGALLTRKQISVRIEQLLDKNRARLHRSPAAAAGVVLAGMLAVAFVATSAPAVELPVVASELPAPAHHVTTAAAPPVSADPLTDQKIAELEAQMESAATPAPVRVVERIIVQQHVAKTNVTLPDVAPAAAPSAPAMPAMPVMPTVHPMAPHPPPASTKHFEINLDGPAAMRLKDRIGADIARSLRETLASLPKEIAQDAGNAEGPARPLGGVKLSRSALASCHACSLRGADLRNLDLRGITLTGDNLNGADLRGANLAGAHLNGVSLVGANLAGANLRGAQLAGVELRGADFDGAQLEDIKLTGVSLQHVSLRGTTLRSVVASCAGCDFSGMDLRGQDLHGIAMIGADFGHADLRDANLAGARLSGVNLSHANLSGANLTNASFSGCNLTGTDLHGAQTTGMTLQGSGLDG